MEKVSYRVHIQTVSMYMIYNLPPLFMSFFALAIVLNSCSGYIEHYHHTYMSKEVDFQRFINHPNKFYIGLTINQRFHIQSLLLLPLRIHLLPLWVN